MDVNDYIRRIELIDTFTELEYLVYNSDLLFYGELDSYFLDDLVEILKYISLEDKPKPYLFDTSKSYWYLISILNAYKYIDYGTSPRFPWLTDKGVKLFNEIQEILDEQT